jgi:hypothetical protein
MNYILANEHTHYTSFKLISDDSNDGELLSRSDLEDFVDTDIEVVFNNKRININNYLGDSVCFQARQRGHSF